jgi:hypothetical protein
MAPLTYIKAGGRSFSGCSCRVALSAEGKERDKVKKDALFESSVVLLFQDNEQSYGTGGVRTRVTR